MNDLCYCQYAFAQPRCRVDEIGPGVDPHYNVELVCDGPIAAVISRVGLEQFSPERLQGKTPEDMQWLGEVAARHNAIICHAANGCAVLPLRLGTVFRSRESMQAMLARCRPTVAKFLEQLGDRQEWGVKLYQDARAPQPIPGHACPAPHFLEQRRATGTGSGSRHPYSGQLAASADPAPSTAPGTNYLAQKRAQLDSRREQRVGMYETIQIVEQRLNAEAESSCRIRNLPRDLTGHAQEMVFNAAFLLPAAQRPSWLETAQSLGRDVHKKGLLLEISGPWPPYHFCPNLEL
jgi:hypothetical protein